MKIKNISGRQLSIGIGGPCVTVPANGTAVFPDTPQAQADASRFIKLEYIELVDASEASEFEQSPDVEDSILLLATGQPSDADTITINGVVFEWDSNATTTTGNVAVTIGGSVAASVAALQTAVNANATLIAANIKFTDKITVGASDVRGVIRGLGTTAISQSESSSNIAISAVAAVTNEGYRKVLKTVTATGATLLFDTGLTSIVAVNVQVRNAAGRVKLYDGAILVSDGLVFLSNDDGAGGANTTDIASTDLVTIEAIGK